MYRRILLASDRTQESLVALREGALIAQTCKAEVFLLIVDPETPGSRVADSVHPLPESRDPNFLLELGMSRLNRLGVASTGKSVRGEPASLIANVGRRFRADLIVIGHRRQSLVDRWWSGSSGIYIVDGVSCSVLIARNLIGDADFEAQLDPAT